MIVRLPDRERERERDQRERERERVDERVERERIVQFNM